MGPYPAYPFWKIYTQSKMGIDTTIILYYMYIIIRILFTRRCGKHKKGFRIFPRCAVLVRLKKRNVFSPPGRLKMCPRCPSRSINPTCGRSWSSLAARTTRRDDSARAAPRARASWTSQGFLRMGVKPSELMDIDGLILVNMDQYGLSHQN